MRSMLVDGVSLVSYFGTIRILKAAPAVTDIIEGGGQHLSNYSKLSISFQFKKPDQPGAPPLRHTTLWNVPSAIPSGIKTYKFK